MTKKKSTPAQIAARKKHLSLLGNADKKNRLVAAKARRSRLDTLVGGS